MTSHDVEIVPATNEIYARLAGEQPRFTIRALAAKRDDAPIGIAGVYMDEKYARRVMFSYLTDDLRKDKRSFVRFIRSVMRMSTKLQIPIYAKAQEDIEGSDKLLEHIGFEHTENGVYVWHF